MAKNYSRISEKDRFTIHQLLVEKKSYSQIALAINKDVSNVRREVKRCPKNKYNILDAIQAAGQKFISRTAGKIKIKKNENLENFVIEKLGLRWSPEQIHLDLIKHFPTDTSMQVATETIYNFIYVHCKPELKKEYIAHLRQKRKYRGNTRRGKDKRSTIKDPIRIDERPKEVDTREVPGHWEGDLVMGKNRESYIGTLNERTTRTVILIPLKSKDAETVRKAFEKAFKNIPKSMKKTLTYDNGTEMAQHKLFTKNTKINVYFAHPYSPWERPTNENSNGLIRDFFPKGTDFNLVSKKQLQKVQDLLNERPRKVLNGCTPKEVFEDIILNKWKIVNLKKKQIND
jgi:IS30 family transposase